MVQERKISKPQPPGTISHVVDFSETLQSIAAHYDITPSELAKLNRLSSRTIFPGQTLFVPGEDYVSAQSMSPPNHSPTSKTDPFIRKFEIPMVMQQEKALPQKKVPGHVERLSPPSSAPTTPIIPIPAPPADASVQDNRKAVLRRRMTDDEAKSLDQDCHERFIKVNVKYITDGQGVIEGTLLVTPNALMFDPNVSDPLVIERGTTPYGMIAPMDTIISATLYHDIAAMNRKRSHDKSDSDQPKHEVYYGCGFDVNKRVITDKLGYPDKIILKPDATSSREHDKSDPDCVNNGDDLNKLDNIGASDDQKLDLDSSKVNNQIDDTMEFVDKDDVLKIQQEYLIRDRLNSDQKSVRFDNSNNEILGVSSIEETEHHRDESHAQVDINSVDDNTVLTDTTIDPDTVLVEYEISSAVCAKSVENYDNTQSQDNLTDDEKTNSIEKRDDVSKSDQSLNPSDVFVDNDNKNIDNSVKNIENESKPNADVFTFDDIEQIKTDANSELNSTGTPSTGKSSGVFSSSISSITGSPHINSFVNYATGLFRNTSDDRSLVKDITVAASKLTKIPDAIHTGGSSLLTGGSNLLSSLIPDGLSLSPESKSHKNAVKLHDMPELFQRFDELIPKPATVYDDPPLYLNIHVGEPINKQASSTCVIEAYGKKRKKPEYWFSVPRDKVDQLYAFFVQWTPDKYGDADDFDPTERGFVVLADDSHGDESLELFNDYFGDSPRVQRDWEIVSHKELLRRQSTYEVLPHPELIGTSVVLSDDDIDNICPFLPARAVGYCWTLVYSSEQHGFSLKTLYRNMLKLDCPILLAVKDTGSNVFGALASVPFKVSEHFYGTGESFLYKCTPEFQLYRWTGQNNFFIKGNINSLAIGAGKGIFGLWFDSDLYHGTTHPCDTYNNEVLSVAEDFVVQTLEAWAFIDT